MKLLDTTFLIHYWGGHSDAREYLEIQDQAEFVTTTLNIKELAVGRAIQGALDPFEIRSTFEWLTVVPFRFEHAIHAGELEATLHGNDAINQDRINSLTGDVLIAAVARETGATVVTRNDDDFQLFDGVTVESY